MKQLRLINVRGRDVYYHFQTNISNLQPQLLAPRVSGDGGMEQKSIITSESSRK